MSIPGRDWMPSNPAAGDKNIWFFIKKTKIATAGPPKSCSPCKDANLLSLIQTLFSSHLSSLSHLLISS